MIPPAVGWLVTGLERTRTGLVVEMRHPESRHPLLIVCADEGEAVAWSCVRRLGEGWALPIRPNRRAPAPSLRKRPPASTAPCTRVERDVGWVLRAPA